MLDKILVKEIVGPIIVIVSSIIVYNVFRKIGKAIIMKGAQYGEEKKTKTLIVLFNNILKYILIIVSLLIILEIFKIDTKTIVASIGAIGVVAGLALQDVLKDFFAGIFILIENQYKIGDYITIGGFKGEVIALGMKTTKIKAYTGEIKMISNRFITEVINHSLEDNMAIVDVSIDYEADLLSAERVLKNVCKELNTELKPVRGKIEVLGVEELGNDGIVFRIVAPCTPMMQYDVQRVIRKKILLALEFNKINIPYHQVVVHNG